MNKEQWFFLQEKLPEIGQRVVTLTQKEMVFMGDVHDNSSEWLDDGEGERGVIMWREI